MNSPVVQIKERLSIEDVVSTYIKLEKAGNNLKAKCPFHNEKTPSFFVSPDRGSYYCFGCAASGDIFTFVEEFEGLDFKGALKLLAERAGVPLESYKAEEGALMPSEKERLYQVMEESALYYSNNLLQNKQALDYLKSRGLKDETIKDFRIGFAKPEWRELYNYLQQKNFTDIEIEKAGLAKKTDKGMYDRFRSRIIFPIADSSGRIIAFSGRIFSAQGGSASGGGDTIEQPKYLNSPETPIFSKHAVLYGLNKAKESIRKNNFSILVEGQMDLILSHQAGYKNTVATSGTALTDSTEGNDRENTLTNLGLVRRLSENIVLAFDADKAGLNASLRAGKIALSLGMDVKVASMPRGMDPADLIGKEGVDAWRETIKNSKHIIEFLLVKVLEDSSGDMRKAGREIKEKILLYVDMLQSSIEKMHFLKKISDTTSIPISALEDDLKKIEQALKYEKEELDIKINNEAKMFRKDYIERKLLGIGLWKEDKKILDKLHLILEKYKDIKQDLIFEAEVFYEGNEDLERDVNEMLGSLEEEELNEELVKKMQELRQIKDKESEIKILKEINELNKKKEDIKNNRLKKYEKNK